MFVSHTCLTPTAVSDDFCFLARKTGHGRGVGRRPLAAISCGDTSPKCRRRTERAAPRSASSLPKRKADNLRWRWSTASSAALAVFPTLLLQNLLEHWCAAARSFQWNSCEPCSVSRPAGSNSAEAALLRLATAVRAFPAGDLLPRHQDFLTAFCGDFLMEVCTDICPDLLWNTVC